VGDFIAVRDWQKTTKGTTMTFITIAETLAKVCPPDTLASVLASLLSASDNSVLTDDEADAGQALSDALFVTVPESVLELAQSI
jgi:hypothetical protein